MAQWDDRSVQEGARAMMDEYDGTTFGDLAEQERAANECEKIDYVI